MQLFTPAVVFIADMAKSGRHHGMAASGAAGAAPSRPNAASGASCPSPPHSKGGVTAMMRTARDDDPDVRVRPKATRHYVFAPGHNKFMLAGVVARSAENVDSVVHNFSYVPLWRHRAAEKPRYLGYVDRLEWWEQELPQEPLFPYCVVSDTLRRMVFYNYGGPENPMLLQNLKRKAFSDDGRQAAIKFMRGHDVSPSMSMLGREGLSEIKTGGKPNHYCVWPAGVLNHSSRSIDLFTACHHSVFTHNIGAEASGDCAAALRPDPSGKGNSE